LVFAKGIPRVGAANVHVQNYDRISYIPLMRLCMDFIPRLVATTRPTNYS